MRETPLFTSSRLRRGVVSGLLGAGALTMACIPSYPPCTCGDGQVGPYPDFDLLDRSAPCASFPLPGGDSGGDGDGDGDGMDAACGYPSGPYGFDEGAVFENLELFNCLGEQVQIAQYLPQEGLPGVETRGVVFGVGAGWCAPCAEEAKEWAELFVDEYEPQGIQFIQALDDGALSGSAATMELCAGWSTANAEDKFPILFTPDVMSLQSKLDGQSGEPIPYTFLFNANAQIIFKQTGGIVDSGVLQVQLDKLINDPYGN